jgi:hypothetical protein
MTVLVEVGDDLIEALKGFVANVGRTKAGGLDPLALCAASSRATQ